MPRSLEPRAQLLWYLIESGGFGEVGKKVKNRQNKGVWPVLQDYKGFVVFL